jgi:hypothetical protein
LRDAACRGEEEKYTQDFCPKISSEEPNLEIYSVCGGTTNKMNLKETGSGLDPSDLGYYPEANGFKRLL